MLSALRGALGFLTRLPVGGDAADWRAFAGAPWTFPAVGWLLGAVLAVPVLAARTVGLAGLAVPAFLVVWVGLLGITHLDGVADLGDAAVVHGDPDDRVAVLKDSDVGVGAVVALVVALLTTALAAVALAGMPGISVSVVVAVVVGAELGAKTAMAVVACGFEARHEGLGSQLTAPNGPASLFAVGLVVVAVGAAVAVVSPAAILPWLGATLGAVLSGWLLARWANRLLGGVNGDVFGAVDVAARAVGLWVGAVLIGTTTVLAAGGPP